MRKIATGCGLWLALMGSAMAADRHVEVDSHILTMRADKAVVPKALGLGNGREPVIRLGVQALRRADGSIELRCAELDRAPDLRFMTPAGERLP